MHKGQCNRRENDMKYVLSPEETRKIRRRWIWFIVLSVMIWIIVISLTILLRSRLDDTSTTPPLTSNEVVQGE